MRSMSLSQLACGLADIPSSLAAAPICDITLDSRQVTTGAGFIAIQGAQTDGRRFIPDALEKGAAVVLAEPLEAVDLGPRVVTVPDLKSHLGELAKRFYADPSAQLALLAVTGTNGKTSISDYIGQLLRLLGESAGTIGTLGARLRSGEAAESQNTTPDVISLNRQLADWVDQGVRFVALEASSHALEQSRMDGLTVHTGVFSNLTRDHLDYHGNLDSYRNAKLRLFTDFTPDRVIYNADDPSTQGAREASANPALGVSLVNASADVYVKVLDETPTGLRFQIHSPYGTAEIDSALHGRFNAFNVAVAVIAVTGLGFAFTQVASAAEHLLPVDGRMQEVKGGGDLRVVVDYAHTPDALASALGALKPSCAGMLWVVFGCGGDRDVGKRSEMGKIATSLADQLIVTNDNPRSEAPDAIANDILRGVGTSACHVELDRSEAIRYAVLNAQPGDTVLVAGKGHESYQLVGDKKLDFSDVDCAAQALREREVAYA